MRSCALLSASLLRAASKACPCARKCKYGTPVIRLLLSGVAAIVLSTPAMAQLGKAVPVGLEPGTSVRAPRAKDCGKTPLAGIWTGDGRVAFTIDSSGQVDTLTVMAVRRGH